MMFVEHRQRHNGGDTPSRLTLNISADPRRWAAAARADRNDGTIAAGEPAAAGPVARSPQELEHLRQRDEQIRSCNLNLREADGFARVGPVRVGLSKASGRRQRYSLALEIQEHVVEMRGRTLHELIRCYDERARRTLEVVVYRFEPAGAYYRLPEPPRRLHQRSTDSHVHGEARLSLGLFARTPPKEPAEWNAAVASPGQFLGRRSDAEGSRNGSPTIRRS
jgi:hypothetical protein